MDQRLGDLAQEFKDLVYPAHYNPDGKPAPKRKPGEGSAGPHRHRVTRMDLHSSGETKQR